MLSIVHSVEVISEKIKIVQRVAVSLKGCNLIKVKVLIRAYLNIKVQIDFNAI